VNRDESQESLASQAAAWVPPWERERPESGAAPLPDPAPPVDAEPSAEGEPEPEADAEVGGEPEADAEVGGEPEADAETGPEPDGDPGAAAGTPELPEGSEPDGEPGDVAVTVESAAPEPLPAEADVAEPGGEELSAEAAGTPAEEAGEDAPVAADRPGPDVAAVEADPLGQLPLEGLAPPPGELPAVHLRAALEAILLVVDEPVAEVTLALALEQPTARVAVALSQLAGEYEGEGRGFELRRAAGGWRLYTRSRYAGYVERFVLDGQSVRLTQAALETLAVVAYKQPVTRSRISAIRGVNCDGVVRTLVTRGLIEECGAEPDTGAHLYRTTGLFLEKLGLDSVDQLPPLAPFLPDELDEIADAQR
jgi:segregation and condensation protein B